MSRTAAFYVDRANAAFAAGFPTKTAQQDAMSDLNRAYELLTDAIKAPFLNTELADRTAKQEQLYYALPFNLHQWRAKYGALAVAVYPETADVVAQIEALAARREEMKSAPVVKVAKIDKADPALVAAADKIQTRGNCPCCGREQAVLSSGLMSKHGYTVEDGWFNGVCHGDRHAPMQVQREVTDAIVAQVREEAAALEARADALKAGTETLGKVRHPGRYFAPGEKVELVEFSSLNAYQQRDVLDSTVWAIRNRAKVGRDFADFMAKLVNAVHGQALRVVAL